MTDPYKQWQVPERVARLKDLVYNLWWSWHPEARALFKEIDRNLWRTTYHNPVLLLQRSLPRLNALVNDEVFIELIDELSPGVLKINGPFLYVVMPMRLS